MQNISEDVGMILLIQGWLVFSLAVFDGFFMLNRYRKSNSKDAKVLGTS